MHERGLTPNLSRLVEGRGYSRFEVANPPQSEVSWTSIATGLNPGQHGMFDFVHRDPSTYTPFLSLLPTQRKFGVTRFVRPFSARTIFDAVADQGYPATTLWWPGTFPARAESPVRTLPGLGTPDLLGRLGVGCLYTSDPEAPAKLGKTLVRRLTPEGSHRYSQEVVGPKQKKGSEEEALTVRMGLEIKDAHRAVLHMGRLTTPLSLGRWSPILDFEFRVNRLISIRAITRAILTEIGPITKLYMLPIQLHPLHSVWAYGTPGSFVRRTWEHCGPFLTLGWPQDTTGLEDGCINDEQFRSLCESIFSARACVLLHHLEEFREGLLASVFDTGDRIQHMYWRDRPEVVEEWYAKYDALVGDVLARYPLGNSGDQRLVILSDHGFERWEYGVHLNRWLIDHGYLASPLAESGDMKSVDWRNTQAYAIGLNALYINVAEREGQGTVPIDRVHDLAQQIRSDLLRWEGPDGRAVVQEVWLNQDVFIGDLAKYGPDLVIGYTPGYRASPDTGLGGWKAGALVPNRAHWGGDHCFDPRSVPGVLLANRDLTGYARPSYRDVPALTIDASPGDGSSDPPPSVALEDEAIMEERMRSLGYL